MNFVESNWKDLLWGFAIPMTNRIYLEHGKPVPILVRWCKGSKGSRNVLILRADGTKVFARFAACERSPATANWLADLARLATEPS
jgi:hypothetical protein